MDGKKYRTTSHTPVKFATNWLHKSRVIPAPCSTLQGLFICFSCLVCFCNFNISFAKFIAISLDLVYIFYGTYNPIYLFILFCCCYMIIQVLADNIGIPCKLVKGSHYTGMDDDAINIIKLDERFALPYSSSLCCIDFLYTDITFVIMCNHFLSDFISWLNFICQIAVVAYIIWQYLKLLYWRWFFLQDKMVIMNTKHLHITFDNMICLRN